MIYLWRSDIGKKLSFNFPLLIKKGIVLMHRRTVRSLICGTALLLYLVLSYSTQTALAAPHKTPGKKVQPHTVIGSSQIGASPAIYGFNNQLYVLTVVVGTGRLSLAQSSDGVSFTVPTILNDTTQLAYAAQMTSFQGHLYVAWFSSNGNKQIYLGYYDNSPTLANHTAIPGSCVGGNTNGEGDPGPVMTTFNNKLYVAWADCNNAAIDIASSSDGYNFTIVQTNIFTHLVSSMAVINNHLYLTWTNLVYPLYINYGTYPGTGTQMSKVVTLAYMATLYTGMMPFNGHMYMAWSEFTDRRTYIGYYNGTNQFSQLQILSNVQSYYGVSLATAFGHVYIAWADRSTVLLNIAQVL